MADLSQMSPRARMSVKANSPLFCSVLHSGTRMRARRQMRHSGRLAMTDAFLHSTAWRTLRAAFLRANPRCCVPGCPTPADTVDHIRSRRRGGAPLDPNNLQGFCATHHNAKTARLDHPDRRASIGPLRVSGCDAAGRPLAPDHPWNGATWVGRT